MATVALGALAVPAVEARASGTGAPVQPTGCDASRPGVVHGPDARLIHAATTVPCLTTTFPDFGESSIVETSTGAVMHGSVYDTQPGGVGPTGYVARTPDKGSHWEMVKFPPRPPEASRGSGDPQLWRDPITNRIYYTTIGSILGCETDLSYTDDGGATWTTSPDNGQWGCPAAFDFPRPFTGPPTTDKGNMHGYPDVLYICKSSHATPSRQCWNSVDGGKTFAEIGGSPTSDVAGTMGAWTADLKGNVYGVADGNLNVSGDEGITWKSNPVPAGFGSPPGGTGPTVDSQGIVYLVAIDSKSLPAVVYSKDQGKTWSSPLEVQMPGVHHVDQVNLAVGQPGQIAVAYVGNGDASDATDVPPYHRGGPHHGYLTTTDTNLGDNLFSSSPVFTSVQVDSNTDPLLPYGFPNLANTSVTVSRADYIGVTIGPDGQPWAYFYKDLCSTPLVCDNNPPLIYTAFYSTWTNWMGAVATIWKP